MVPLPGAEAALAAHGPALPQPDQLCGPFSAWVALHAVLATPPSVVDLARAGGTRVWPHEEAAFRPAGAGFVTTGWSELPEAAEPGESGTDAAGVARAVQELTDVVVVPAGGADRSGLGGLLDALASSHGPDRPAGSHGPVGVLANVRTGPITPPGHAGWDVGHFVVLWGWDAERAEVGVADTYPEVGSPGSAPGCRVVGVDALARALHERGLLLLAAPEDRDHLVALVEHAGLGCSLWRT